MQKELKNIVRIRWIVLAVLIAVLLLEQIILSETLLFFPPTYFFAAIAIAANILWSFWVNKGRYLKLCGYLQIYLDLILLLGNVYISGGVESAWGALPSLIIMAAGFYFSFASGIVMAIVAWIFLHIMIHLEYNNIIPHFGIFASNIGLYKNWYYLFDYILAIGSLYTATAIIAGLLGDKVRGVRRELELEVSNLNRELEKKLEDTNAELYKKNKELEEAIGHYRMAADERRETEEKFKIVFEYAPDAYYISDLKGSFIDGNRAAEKLIGYNKHELVGKSFLTLKLLSADQLGKAAGLLAKNALGHPTGPDEFTLNRKDGKKVTMEISTYPIKIEDKVIILGIARDVSGRKEQEIELKKSEGKFKMLSDSAPIGIYQTDLAGKVTYVNQKICEIFDYCGPVSDFNWRKYLHPEDTERVLGGIAQAISNKEDFISEFRIIRESGEIRWVRVRTIWVRDDKGEDVSRIGIIIDSTDEKRMDQMKDEFVSMITHELRTPITIGREAITQLLEGLRGEITTEQKEVLHTALKNVDQLKNLVNDILDVSKIEAGKMTIRKDPVDIVKLLNEVAMDMRFEALEKDLEFRISLPKEKVIVNADRGKLIEIFNNLIGNAIKFTDKGWIEVSLEEGKDEVVCAVEDSGIGISKDDLPKLFHKFEQFSRKNIIGQKGTGLGLSIVKSLVELHGGKVWSESQLHKGSKFILTIPKK